uniref:Uncharacterized protein n=1 Tax=Oryza rufipogon TaxID=4529 RepID=A0A0E0PIP4_ORYRU
MTGRREHARRRRRELRGGRGRAVVDEGGRRRRDAGADAVPVCTKILRGRWVPFAVSVALVMVIGWYYGRQRKTEMRRLLAAMGAAEEAAASAAAAAAVPALFVGGAPVGGLDGLMGLHLSGRLVPRLREVGALCG